MIERTGELAYNWKIHEGDGDVSVQWYFFERSALPVAIQTWELDPGQSEGMHVHPETRPLEEFYMVLQGEARMRLDDETHILGPGDAVLAKVGQNHDLINSGSERLRILVIWGQPGEVDWSFYEMGRFTRKALAGAAANS